MYILEDFSDKDADFIYYSNVFSTFASVLCCLF